MALTPAKVFKDVREHYLQNYLSQIAIALAGGRLVATECFRKNMNGEVVAQDKGGFPFRADLVLRREDGSLAVESVLSEEMLGFSTLRVRHDSAIPLEIGPFVWNAALIEVTGLPPANVAQSVELWAARWFGLHGGAGSARAH